MTISILVEKDENQWQYTQSLAQIQRSHNVFDSDWRIAHRGQDCQQW
jgi:hypothetical protein